jgi:hypothetical protein
VGVETREEDVIVKIAYGISQRVTSLKCGEFAITRANAAAFELAGC